jgi:ABC-type cobalamin/Fe3+-siderophores transport system ATPase subunit
VRSACNVTFGYRDRRRTGAFGLRDLSLTIQPGSLTGLLGPNGCGKTTLLKLLSGVLHPESGSVSFQGRALEDMSRREAARHIATVPQETHPIYDYSCLEMVLMGRYPHLHAFEFEGPEDLRIAQEAMAATGTSHLVERTFTTLSGGEKQRVVIAAALAQAGDMLLLDEPTASLDLGFQLDVAELLTRLNRERGVTILLATHDVNLAAGLCDSLVLMRAGRIIAHGRTHDVLSASAIARLYDVEADISFHQRAGHLTVTPLQRVPR